MIVIPVYNYYKEFCQWEKLFFEAQQKREQERNKVLQASSALVVNDIIDDVEEATEDASDIVDEALKQIKLSDSSNSESTA